MYEEYSLGFSDDCHDKITAMDTVEILIAVLLGLLVVVCLIYLTYFSVKSHQLRVKRYESGDIDGALLPTGKRWLTVALLCYFAVSVGLFATKVVYAGAPLFGNEYWVSVNSSSMASVHSANTYVAANSLTEKIYCYDLAAFKKDFGELKQYDVILFQKENKYIVHRIIDDPGQENFHTQGDANPQPDNWTVTASEVLGVYDRTIPFLSFLNYLGYTPGFYVAWFGATAGFAIGLYFEIKAEALRKKILAEHPLR